ncbi:MAG: 50S ribosomal protein L24 [Peptoniphilaceae bacterium]|nr:50S ribosomal protein L24 [Peptoniphilaceae bacterium]MCI6659953.1 50S ribosomal protein L24 [Peptoniphilaceae bacterium]MDD7434389.1 50S ribosomal protein L24 [Peptoniphilaceae bacterium]MDY3076381.1 50S ribosomal protein L24 [Peptoniphilaceae bacterium]MDY3986712.1 50S ribosomal protein L24 [Peptoniphilaceae bacterium]
MHVKTGDKVQVIAGKDKGMVGEVLRVFPKENRVIVRDVNIQTKHRKPQGMNQPGGLIKAEGSIHASNVLLYDEAVKRGVRTKKEISGDKKVRVSVKSDTKFDK